MLQVLNTIRQNVRIKYIYSGFGKPWPRQFSKKKKSVIRKFPAPLMPEHTSRILNLLDELPPAYNYAVEPVGPATAHPATLPSSTVSEEIAPTFEVLINVLQAPKRVRTANRKTKTEKQDPLSFGPTNVPVSSSWMDFLSSHHQQTRELHEWPRSQLSQLRELPPY